MYRSCLAAMTLVVLAGCTQSGPPSPGNLATPLAAAPASAATSATAPSTPAPSDPAATAARPRAAAKPVISGVPPVLLSVQEAGLCKLGVGDELPAIELPEQDGGQGKLADLAGEQATIVLFWTPDPWMSRTALADIQRDVADNADFQGVKIVGVIVGGKPDAVQADIEKASAKFTQLVDADGKTLAECGSPTLPRVYVLAADKKIAWFDIEYSETTRRELQATLTALAPTQR